jgi:hypothetical protein
MLSTLLRFSLCLPYVNRLDHMKFATSALILSVAGMLASVEAGAFAGCFGPNGTSCFRHSCEQWNCCNFFADIKNLMQSGWVDDEAGCIFYVNSGCVGATYNMNSTYVENLSPDLWMNQAAVRCQY